jgi:hypothetical protein
MAIAYSLKVIVDSWILGHVSTLLLKRVIPLSRIGPFNLLRSEKVNRLIGVGVLKWVLANSFIKHFNRRLQLSEKKPDSKRLIGLREAMTYAEVVHLIGFAYVLVRVLMNIINDEHLFMIAPLFALNVVVNLYPVLLQQSNKRRVDRVLASLSNRESNGGPRG